MKPPVSSSAEPLYKQLEASLKEAILCGEFKPGQQIPTENELSMQLQVSRVTVRKALNALTNENLLTRVSGKGTFVTSQKFQRSMTDIMSFSELCQSLGKKAGARTIKSVFESVNNEEKNLLGMTENEKAVVIERIRYIDDLPISLETIHLPPSFSFLLEEDLNNRSLYECLRKKYGLWFTHASKTVELVYANFDIAHYLGVAERYPLILITAQLEDNNGKLSCLSKQLIVGDKIRFTL
ncbi:GntR family transcriptional regulator [Citrobacter portucalensis]|uniref:GntR family transcriptional regulator n=1 Tax=Citrobacter portucalensis TaxID=1639133 RepID=UPI0024DF04D2|nr:GntR family transcriptional regulator [Citrobacter portucalensis]MDK2579371.1 GntR family transcriptional regulator [Citrobacter portucalensis]